MATFYLMATLIMMILQGLLFSYDASSTSTSSSSVVPSTTDESSSTTMTEMSTTPAQITSTPSSSVVASTPDASSTSTSSSSVVLSTTDESSSTMMTEMSTTPTQITSTPSSSVVASTPDASSTSTSSSSVVPSTTDESPSTMMTEMSTTPAQMTSTPSSSVVASTPGPIVILMLTITTTCSGDRLMTLKASLQIDIKVLYEGEGFQIKLVVIQSTSCTSRLTITIQLSFYTGIPPGKTIKGVFQDALKDGKITNLTESNTIYNITFTGITLASEYTPKDGQCQAVCCDGAGGALTVERKCTPTDKCKGIEPDEKEEDGHCPKESKGTCSDICDDEGSGGIHNSPSYALVTLLAIAAFIKTIFRF